MGEDVLVGKVLNSVIEDTGKFVVLVNFITHVAWVPFENIIGVVASRVLRSSLGRESRCDDCMWYDDCHLKQYIKGTDAEGSCNDFDNGDGFLSKWNINPGLSVAIKDLYSSASRMTPARIKIEFEGTKQKVDSGSWFEPSMEIDKLRRLLFSVRDKSSALYEDLISYYVRVWEKIAGVGSITPEQVRSLFSAAKGGGALDWYKKTLNKANNLTKNPLGVVDEVAELPFKAIDTVRGVKSSSSKSLKQILTPDEWDLYIQTGEVPEKLKNHLVVRRNWSIEEASTPDEWQDYLDSGEVSPAVNRARFSNSALYSGRRSSIMSTRVSVSTAKIDSEYGWLWDELKPLLLPDCKIPHLRLLEVGAKDGLITKRGDGSFIPSCHFVLVDNKITKRVDILLGATDTRKVLCLRGGSSGGSGCISFKDWNEVIDRLNKLWSVKFDDKEFIRRFTNEG